MTTRRKPKPAPVTVGQLEDLLRRTPRDTILLMHYDGERVPVLNVSASTWHEKRGGLLLLELQPNQPKGK